MHENVLWAACSSVHDAAAALIAAVSSPPCWRMLCWTRWSWCSLFWCVAPYLPSRDDSSCCMRTDVCHWTFRSTPTQFEYYVPDHSNILFAATEHNFMLHYVLMQRYITEVISMTDLFFSFFTHFLPRSSITISKLPAKPPRWCFSWLRSSLEHVGCGLTSTCTQVRITGQADDVPLEHLPLSAM